MAEEPTHDGKVFVTNLGPFGTPSVVITEVGPKLIRSLTRNVKKEGISGGE